MFRCDWWIVSAASALPIGCRDNRESKTGTRIRGHRS